MWHRLAEFMLKYRVAVLLTLILSTGVMGYFATKVRMSYEMASAIPEDNPKYKEYAAFKKMFGEDGTMLVIGFDQKNAFTDSFFTAWQQWQTELKAIQGVESILGVPTAIHLVKQVGQDSTGQERLVPVPVFDKGIALDSAKQTFFNLPFYRGLLYNPSTNSYLTAVYLNKTMLFSKQRVQLVKDIVAVTDRFGTKTGLEIHYSGLPFIRTQFAESVKHEMNLILGMSLLLTALILLLFFRSGSAVFFSMLIIGAGVVWAMGFLGLFEYKITILSALIAPLIVVIGVPNCIYFLNKYHTQYIIYQKRDLALRGMVGRMGIVTLFTNLTAAIGFGVFYFTESKVLKEFGLVSGLSITAVFFLSLFAIPVIFSYLPAPKERHMKYLENKSLSVWLQRFEGWVMNHSKWIYIFWGALLVVSVWGMLRLKSEGHVVDDLPKNDKLYTDLNYFESNFKGVIPLEIVVDTRKKSGATSLGTIKKLDELADVLQQYPALSKPLSMVEAIKFARQAYYDGDSNSYAVPNGFDVAFLLPYLKMKAEPGSNSTMGRLVNSFTDSSRRYVRMSVNMADVGSAVLPSLLDSIQQQANGIFDTSRYTLTYTGTGVVFLEGSKFIINSLVDSLLLALLMIIACMAFLFRNSRIVIISIITNTIPLVITAGVMGHAHIPLKPSTVLVFSIALGIAIDVTIRFLVNYKQDLPVYHYNVAETVKATIRETGLSIIYTSLILTAGFVVFLVSQFDGTKALGYLTALTLFLAMMTNLTILPALLRHFDKQKKKEKK
jgi:predicted RND superfamily exporter protein